MQTHLVKFRGKKHVVPRGIHLEPEKSERRAQRNRASHEKY